MDKAALDLHGFAPDRSSIVLLVLDLVSDFEFEDGARVFRAALPVAKRIAHLKTRAAAAGVPTIYVNDNHGRWRSDFAGLLRHCTQPGVRGAPIVELIRPGPDDYCVLKPKHSGFFATALDTLLEYIGADTLILTGVSSNQCVLFTANDAYVRDLKLVIPRDCISAPSRSATQLALRYFKTVLDADVRSSTELKFPRARRRTKTAR